MRITDIMDAPVACCGVGDDLQRVAELMLVHDADVVVAVDGARRPVGVVTIHAIAARIMDPPSERPTAADVLDRPVLTISDDGDAAEADRLLERYDAVCLAVVGAGGALVGLVRRGHTAP